MAEITGDSSRFLAEDTESLYRALSEIAKDIEQMIAEVGTMSSRKRRRHVHDTLINASAAHLGVIAGVSVGILESLGRIERQLEERDRYVPR